MKRLFPLLLFISATLLPAQSPHKRLAASTISYSYDTPPNPHGGFHYRITIKPDRSATIWYLLGGGNSIFFGEGTSIGPLNPHPPTTRTFQLTPPSYDTLLDTLLAQGILVHDWPTKERPVVGGSRQLLTIQRSRGTIITIHQPRIVLVSEANPAARFEKIAEAIRAAIPDTAWTAIDTERGVPE